MHTEDSLPGNGRLHWRSCDCVACQRFDCAPAFGSLPDLPCWTNLAAAYALRPNLRSAPARLYSPHDGYAAVPAP